MSSILIASAFSSLSVGQLRRMIKKKKSLGYVAYGVWSLAKISFYSLGIVVYSNF